MVWEASPTAIVSVFSRSPSETPPTDDKTAFSEPSELHTTRLRSIYLCGRQEDLPVLSGRMLLSSRAAPVRRELRTSEITRLAAKIVPSDPIVLRPAIGLWV